MNANNQDCRPVYAAIEAFLTDRIQQSEARVLELRALASQRQLTDEHGNEVRRLLEELKRDADELLSWIDVPFQWQPSERQDKNINEAGKVLLSEGGFDLSEVVGIIETAKRKPRGRPAVLRPIALVAWETKLQHQNQKWADIISEICRTRKCGNTSHDNCFKNIKREVERLRRCLRRHNITPIKNTQPA